MPGFIVEYYHGEKVFATGHYDSLSGAYNFAALHADAKHGYSARVYEQFATDRHLKAIITHSPGSRVYL